MNRPSETPKPKRYKVNFTPKANRQFQKLPPAIVQQMAPAILALAENPRPYGYKKMAGRPGFRIRVGTYRVVYVIDDGILLVEIIEVGHRRGVYQ